MLYRTKCRCLLAISAAAVGLFLGAGTAPARADNPAMGLATGTSGFNTDFQTLGWLFTTNSPVTVDALGYFDFGGDGLAVPHEVGIFDSAGNLLTSATVAPGVADPLIDGFRYVSISPYNLPAGQTFTIGGAADRSINSSGFDLWLRDVTSLTSDPSITIPSNAGRFIPTADAHAHFPTMDGESNVFAGPNFLIGPAPSSVPEPNSLALLVTGGLPLLGFLRRRR
jgi:hypothetical protein